VRYWDSSAIVPLLVQQGRTADMRLLVGSDPDLVTWWSTSVECYSALMRLVREGALPRNDLSAAESRLRTLSQVWEEVMPGEACRRVAERILRIHPLRSADALQLAAAIMASDHEPTRLEVVCLDSRLAEVARVEGFRVIG
jgi:predicted nucleic acid-binding protein